MRTRWLATIGTVAVFALSGVANANLLTNGDFQLDDGSDPLNAAGWAEVNNGGWVNREDPQVPGDFHYAIGNAGSISNNITQNVLVPDDGAEYQLSVDAAMDDWWSPTGYLRIEFLDAGSSVIGSQDSVFVANGYDGAVAQPWSPRSVTGVAPSGTASINAVFGGLTDGSSGPPGTGGGTIRFDNASLEVIPEPATMGLFGLAGLTLWFGRRLRV